MDPSTPPGDLPTSDGSQGLSDPRVGYWEPAKWVARLRELKTDDSLLLLKTNMEAGHFGRSGRYEALRDLSEQYAFVLGCFGGQGGST